MDLNSANAKSLQGSVNLLISDISDKIIALKYNHYRGIVRITESNSSIMDLVFKSTSKICSESKLICLSKV